MPEQHSGRGQKREGLHRPKSHEERYELVNCSQMMIAESQQISEFEEGARPSERHVDFPSLQLPSKYCNCNSFFDTSDLVTSFSNYTMDYKRLLQ